MMRDVKMDDNSGVKSNLVWVLRDFSLKLEDEKGNKISSDEYLERCLVLSKSVDDISEKRNKIRRMIKHMFNNRSCYTLVRPTITEFEMNRLDRMKNSELRPEFYDQMKKVRNKILKSVGVKYIRNVECDGSILYQYLYHIINSINNRSIISLPNIHHMILNPSRPEVVPKIDAENTCKKEIIEQIEEVSEKEEDPILDSRKEEDTQEVEVINFQSVTGKDDSFIDILHSEIKGCESIEQIRDIIKAHPNNSKYLDILYTVVQVYTKKQEKSQSTRSRPTPSSSEKSILSIPYETGEARFGKKRIDINIYNIDVQDNIGRLYILYNVACSRSGSEKVWYTSMRFRDIMRVFNKYRHAATFDSSIVSKMGESISIYERQKILQHILHVVSDVIDDGDVRLVLGEPS